MTTTVQPELADRLRDVARAIDNALVAAHGLRASLKPGHVSFDAELAEGVRRYGDGPVVRAVVRGCEALDALSIAWTGKGFPRGRGAGPGQRLTRRPASRCPSESAEAGAEQQERLAGWMPGRVSPALSPIPLRAATPTPKSETRSRTIAELELERNREAFDAHGQVSDPRFRRNDAGATRRDPRYTSGAAGFTGARGP